MNFSWLAGESKVRGYQGQTHSAELLIQQENNHDIGFKWNGTEYELVTDLMFWDQAHSVNKFLNSINQRYAFNLITKVSEEQSFQYVETENQQDGSIRLLLRKF